MRVRNILLGTTLTVAAWLAAANSIGVQARYEDDVEEYSALVAGDTLPVQAKVEHAQKQLNAISLFSVAAKQSAEAKVDEKKSSEYLLDNLLATAYKYLGVRYRSGHSGPDGFDCSGFTSFVLNIFWIIFGGFELCLANLISALFLCITIVGIPFALQALKMAKLSLMPFGKEIV